LELEEGVEGLIHVSEISKDKVKTPVGQFKVDTELKAMVVNINAKERRIGLSMKRLEVEDEKNTVTDYNANQQQKSTLGEVMGKNINVEEDAKAKASEKKDPKSKT